MRSGSNHELGFLDELRGVVAGCGSLPLTGVRHPTETSGGGGGGEGFDEEPQQQQQQQSAASGPCPTIT